MREIVKNNGMILIERTGIKNMEGMFDIENLFVGVPAKICGRLN